MHFAVNMHWTCTAIWQCSTISFSLMRAVEIRLSTRYASSESFLERHCEGLTPSANQPSPDGSMTSSSQVEIGQASSLAHSQNVRLGERFAESVRSLSTHQCLTRASRFRRLPWIDAVKFHTTVDPTPRIPQALQDSLGPSSSTLAIIVLRMRNFISNRGARIPPGNLTAHPRNLLDPD